MRSAKRDRADRNKRAVLRKVHRVSKFGGHAAHAGAFGASNK